MARAAITTILDVGRSPFGGPEGHSQASVFWMMSIDDLALPSLLIWPFASFAELFPSIIRAETRQEALSTIRH